MIDESRWVHLLMFLGAAVGTSAYVFVGYMGYHLHQKMSVGEDW